MSPLKFIGGKFILTVESLSAMLDTLRGQGFILAGPQIQNEAVTLGEIDGIGDLPQGYNDSQRPAHYELHRSDTPAFFNYVVGPQSWKKFLYPPAQDLIHARQSRSGWKAEALEQLIPAYAFIGIRPCEIYALQALDKALAEGVYAEASYSARREKLFILAVNCSSPGGNCFCTSMNSGPKAKSGFDLALTELQLEGRHYFLVETGSKAGIELVKALELPLAGQGDNDLVDRIMQSAEKSIGKKIELPGLKEKLFTQMESPHWPEIAQKCLTCGNCTMVCPTCFCSTIQDTTNLFGSEAVRTRKWDSCFTMDYSYIHGGSIRYSASARYRNWATHKFSTWVDQFGVYGCVGCGRCITWCPAGIDITEEVKAVCQI